MIKIRAKIVIGSLIAGTPPLGYANHILSFNVDKSRAKSSTFSASLKVKHSDVTGTIQGSDIQISSGTSSNMPLIYTGIVKAANMGPCREDPGFVILNISGEDILSRLRGKKFTRRCRSSKGTWVSIESLVRPGIRSAGFQFIQGKPWLEGTGGDLTNVGQPVQTKQIPNPSKQSEKINTSKDPEPEIGLSIVFVDNGGN